MKTETIILGGGCFWCTEAVFSSFKGIIKVVPGYSGGKTKNPTYEQVCTGNTNHAEVIEIKFNSERISLDKILEIFFKVHDPTELNKQGNDVGIQYRSIIFYTTKNQKEKIINFIKNLQKNFQKEIVTEVKKLEKFYPAEEYHKNYYQKNPNQPYCRLIIAPKLKKLMERENE